MPIHCNKTSKSDKTIFNMKAFLIGTSPSIRNEQFLNRNLINISRVELNPKMTLKIANLPIQYQFILSQWYCATQENKNLLLYTKSYLILTFEGIYVYGERFSLQENRAAH